MEEEPLLPGSLAPTDGRLPLAHIYQPSPSALQSALTGRQPEWVLEFEPWDRKEVEPLMGGRPPATRSPRSIGCASPIARARSNSPSAIGWKYVAPPPPVRSFRIKSYADNFR